MSISYILLPITTTVVYMYRNRLVFETVFGFISQKSINTCDIFSDFICMNPISITSDFLKCQFNTGTYKIVCSLSVLKWKIYIFLRQSSDCSPLYVELSFTSNSRQPVRCETCLFYTQSLYRCCSLSLYRSDKEKQNPQITHRVATATFWSTFDNDGKINPGW